MPRKILLLGAIFFGAFAIVSLIVTRSHSSQTIVSIVGGALAYCFLMAVAVLWFRHHRSRRGLSERRISRYLADHPRVQGVVGRPVRVGPIGGELTGGAGQATLTVPVRGPVGEAEADLVMARIDAGWEILAAELLVDGERVPLTGVSGVG
jgi:hypothetical protein